MEHLPKLIQDLALILIVGAIITLLFKRIRQPLVLGYIIAGFFVGPHLSLVPTVADTENVETLAEIGVIFLLFTLGLEMNFKKLLHIGGSASITALVEIIFITLTGYLLGYLLGWSTMDSIFLGGMLASSSTTIIIKAFDDLGEKTKQYAQVVFGVLIVEDIVVILLLVLLPTIAVAQRFEGVELLLTILKLIFFLTLMVVIGIFLLPSFLKKAKKYLNEETLLVLSVGLCLGMVVLATSAGFSAELGAFIMGFIIAESSFADKVEQVTKPVKDLFASVFFVSIGMMIDPAVILKYGWAVLAVTALTIFGKLFSTTMGAIISGQPLKQSVQIGMSMAQIGEFAFIVAALGLSLGVISDFVFPVAVGASAITTFTTPYMIKYSGNLFMYIEKKVPEKWLKSLQNYSTGTQIIKTEKAWRTVLKSFSTILLINSIILLALIILSTQFFIPFLSETLKNDTLGDLGGLVITLGIISPFLWGLMVKKPNDIAYAELWLNRRYNRGPLMVIEIIRVIIGLILTALLVNRIFSTLIAVIFFVPVIFIVFIIFSNQIKKFHQRLESRFLSNLSIYNTVENEVSSGKLKETAKQLYFSPWDSHIIELVVGSHAEYIGKALEHLKWREKYGINIAYIKRGDELIYVPTRYNKLFPNDLVGIIATDEQMNIFKPIFDASDKIYYVQKGVEDIVIQNILVNENNKLKGLSILDSGIREKTNGLVIGIERDGERILNPASTKVFEWGDIVWIVGERNKIHKLR